MRKLHRCYFGYLLNLIRRPFLLHCPSRWSLILTTAGSLYYKATFPPLPLVSNVWSDTWKSCEYSVALQYFNQVWDWSSFENQSRIHWWSLLEPTVTLGNCRMFIPFYSVIPSMIISWHSFIKKSFSTLISPFNFSIAMD